MSRNKLISVVIPAYNHEQFIQKTIRSIIDQSYRTIELIVIDDGSSDGTWTVLEGLREECLKRFVRVVFERQTNHGTCFTLNKLISLAEGEYIFLTASDDMVKAKTLETEFHFLEERPDFVLVVGDNEFIDKNDVRIGWDKNCNAVAIEEAKYKTFAEFLHIEKLGNMFGRYEVLSLKNHIPNGYLIRAESLRNIPPFTAEAPLEDYYMHLQLSKLGKIGFIDQVLFSYRWHVANTVKQKKKMLVYERKIYQYERKLVKKMTNPVWREILLYNHMRKKFLFDFQAVKLYFNINYMVKRLVLKIFNKEYSLIKFKRKIF